MNSPIKYMDNAPEEEKDWAINIGKLLHFTNEVNKK